MKRDQDYIVICSFMFGMLSHAFFTIIGYWSLIPSFIFLIGLHKLNRSLIVKQTQTQEVGK